MPNPVDDLLLNTCEFFLEDAGHSSTGVDSLDFVGTVCRKMRALPPAMKNASAEDLVAYVKTHWDKVDGLDAADAAHSGKVVVALGVSDGLPKAAIVYPANATMYNGKWQDVIPLVCSTGAFTGTASATSIFDMRPTYYIQPEKKSQKGIPYGKAV